MLGTSLLNSTLIILQLFTEILFNVFSIASSDSFAMPDSSFVSLISSIINPGGLDPFALCSIFVCLYFLSSTNFKVCKEGVAVPRIIGIFSTCALLILTSLAENLNPSDEGKIATGEKYFHNLRLSYFYFI